MRVVPFVFVALLMPSTADAAKLPSKFAGDWCPVNSQSSTYQRGRWCRNSDSWKTVNVNGFRSHEEDCKVLSVAAAPQSGHYMAKFKCSGEGDTWTVNLQSENPAAIIGIRNGWLSRSKTA
jgi:hypothetical protein